MEELLNINFRNSGVYGLPINLDDEKISVILNLPDNDEQNNKILITRLIGTISPGDC